MRIVAYLALAALAAAVPSSAQNSARVEIQLANFKFTPADIKLTAGQPVTLHFVNKGSGGHDFTAPEFFKAATMDAATRAKLGKKGRIDLSAGESADVVLTPRAGTYKVKCGHFLHAGFGMTGTITVS
ncbi:MAG TPA: cupredoxin domain-containing protein [Sphingorhabdus sp.]|jgi:plastocyanin|nr:cupredoxin domain-containing protein [Sphingorhabdus sp.]